MKIRVLAAILVCLSGSALIAQLKGGPFRVSEGVMQRRLVHKVEPVCPGDARVQGQVVLKALVSQSGKIENLQLLSGHPLLIPAAIEAAKQWTYKPLLVNDEPVEVETTIRLDFSCPSASGIAGDIPGGASAGAIGSVRTGPASGLDSSIATAQRVRVSSGVSQGLLVKKVAPLYPPDARAQGIQGVVLLKAAIDKEGNIANLELISGHPLLAPAAIEAVKQWKYRPYLLAGQAVEVETQIQVNFTLMR